jgi:hypothetical protein
MRVAEVSSGAEGRVVFLLDVAVFDTHEVLIERE